MRIAMLGWEFPPFISGGLGTACHGLTKALDRLGHEILFVLPRPVDRSAASHVRLLSPEVAERPDDSGAAGERDVVAVEADLAGLPLAPGEEGGGSGRVRLLGVPAAFSSPYDALAPGAVRRPDGSVVHAGPIDPAAEAAAALEDQAALGHRRGPGAEYRGDLIAESERYARLVTALLRGRPFDLIHAHDWLTYPAGQALARTTNRPLVVHVHSTEFDRAGEAVNQRIYDIERRGMMAAVRVIAVSEYTRSICVRRYGVPEHKVDVVYNGIDNRAFQPPAGAAIRSRDKVVLFLGRLTMQKGPDYFIAAAKRVLEKVPETKFIVAGSGDMEIRMIEKAAELGIGHRVFFTGFLRGPDVDRVYRMADCYVMPSVSEPFGIAPLEAMRADVPVIVSKQSGVSEVVRHALKVDFWDIDDIANKIVAVLRHPPLGQTLRELGSVELKGLTWDGAAAACVETYRRAAAAMAVA